MPGTLTYTFTPGQTVYVITNCNGPGAGVVQFPGALVTNTSIPGSDPNPENPLPGIQSAGFDYRRIQRFPVTGTLTVREGIVQEINTRVFESLQNADMRLAVEILGGSVINATIVSPGKGYFPDVYSATLSVTTTGGVITAVNVDDPGAGYTDGVGFTLNLTAASGLKPGAGLVAIIGYDIVDGQVTNATVLNGGGGYIDGVIPVGNSPTPPAGFFPRSAQLVTLTETAGGGDGTARLYVDIQNGSAISVVIFDDGDLYDDGANIAVEPSDIPDAELMEYEMVYDIRLTGSTTSIRIEVPVNPAGEEQQGDIFDNLADALTEYETRVL